MMTRRRNAFGATEVMLAAEALALLSLARLTVALLPFRVIAAWMSKDVGRRPPRIDQAELVKAVIVAVARAQRRMPGRLVCIHEGIAVHRMLRRRGIASRFHYAVSTPRGPLRAHVWVEVEGRSVTRVGLPDGYHLVASFPPDALGGRVAAPDL